MIKKTIIQITVLHQDYWHPGHIDLADLAREMDGGSMMGQSRVVSSEQVSPSRLPEEEKALGGDGTFFGDEDEPS